MRALTNKLNSQKPHPKTPSTCRLIDWLITLETALNCQLKAKSGCSATVIVAAIATGFMTCVLALGRSISTVELRHLWLEFI